MKSLMCLIVMAVITGAWPQSLQPSPAGVPASQKYAGTWWLKADAEERSGFLNGSADCLTWTANKKGFNATPEQLVDKITKFYVAHPESVNLSVIAVWSKVADTSRAGKGAEGQGEVWKNVHWYLDGDWWAQVSEAQQLGFVEGYLWCLKTQVPTPADVYSKPPETYRRRINAFVRANPKLGHEAVAVTLRRYRDQDAMASPQ